VLPRASHRAPDDGGSFDDLRADRGVVRSGRGPADTLDLRVSAPPWWILGSRVPADCRLSTV